MRHHGVIIGIVQDLRDPEGQGRVRVRMPTFGNQLSDWARIASPMAGAGRGLLCRPELEEEVALIFQDDRPIVLGALWNGVDGPPVEMGDPERNNVRALVSRSGHRIRLDDTPNAEKIEILDKDNQRRVLLDAAAQKITIEATTGEVEIRAQAKLTLHAQEIEITAESELRLSAGRVAVSGTPIELN